MIASSSSTQRQDVFLRDMVSSGQSSTDDSNTASTPSIQLTKMLHPFQLYTKKRTDINNNSVEISLLGKTVEHTSLDIATDRSVSVYLAEDGLSATGSMATAHHLIKKMLPITFSSVKKNDKVSVVSCNGTRSGSSSSIAKSSLNSNQPPKVAFRVKSHGKGCNGTVKLFVIPFVVTDDQTKVEDHYFLMIKAKRNSLGKGNNKYGIENAYMFRKSQDNDLIDQIIDRVQAFDASTSPQVGSTTVPVSKPATVHTTEPESKKRRVRSSSNAIQNDSNKSKIRKTVDGSAKEEKQIPAQIVSNNTNSYVQNHNMYQVASKSSVMPTPSTFNNQRPTTTRSIMSQGTVPLSHVEYTNQQQRLPQSYSNISSVPPQTSQPSNSQLQAMMAMMQNTQPSNNYSNDNAWNNTMYQNNNNNCSTSATMSISNLGNAMKNHILELDFQKQYRSGFQAQPQQSSYQPIQYYQTPSQSHTYGDNRALKRTLDEIFNDEFTSNMPQPQFTNLSNLNALYHQELPMPQQNFQLSTDEDIMSVQHQEIVEIIDSIQMFDMPLVNEDDEQLNFFC